MQLIVGYSSLYNQKEVLEEIKENWVLNLLFDLGIEDEDFNLSSYEVNELLYDKKIEIVDFPDINSIQLKLDGEVVAELSSPKFSLLSDDQGPYFKIEMEYWSDIDYDEE